MVLVDSPAVDGPAVLPVDVADDTDGAAEAPLLPLPEVPPESGSPSTLRNPAAERQLSPSRFRLTQRAAEAGASQSEVGEEEGEVGEDERQEGEGAGDAEEVVAPPSPSKVKRFSQLPQLSQSGGLPKWNQFYTAESVNQRVQLMQHPKVKQALDQLWTAANFNAEDEIIDKEEYLLMHRKIVLALEPGAALPTFLPGHPAQPPTQLPTCPLGGRLAMYLASPPPRLSFPALRRSTTCRSATTC